MTVTRKHGYKNTLKINTEKRRLICHLVEKINEISFKTEQNIFKNMQIAYES